MRSVAGVVMPLVAALCVSAPSFAQLATPLTAAAPGDAAPGAPPPTAAPAPTHKSQPWKERLDREPLPEPEPVRSWYGWQTLLVDGLAGGLVALTALDAIEDYWFSIGMLVISSPIVHFAHLNFAHGFTSLTIRSLSAGSFALAVWKTETTDRGGIGWALLSMLGITIAVVLDAASFAWDEQPREEQSDAWITPWLDPQHGRIGLGYTSSF
jgi:hypothetical protein